MNFRLIAEADLEQCADVLYAGDDELMIRHNLPTSPRNRVPLVKLFGHIRDNSPQRCWLAEEDGRIHGFGMSMEYEQVTFLAFLFVLPGLQARGLGRELLERSMAGSTRRAVCIFSLQPISAALYARYGMVPRVPIYIFTGAPREPLPRLAGGLELRPASIAAVDAIDLEISGVSRPKDHELWESLDRRRYGLFDGATLAGYGYVQPSGRLGPVLVRDPAHVLPMVGSLMDQVPAVETWMINVPGPAAETFETLLGMGLHLEGAPILYCSTEPMADHSRYLPSTFALP